MLRRSLQRLKADERGATVVEYALLACVMGMVVVSIAASGLSVASALKSVGQLIGGGEPAVTTPVDSR
jgi:Flp pilus assembly pilin Flp